MIAVVLSASVAGAAAAQSESKFSDIFGVETLHGVADVRLATAGGEKSWLNGGNGKTSVSGGTDLRLSSAALEWKPSFGFAVSGVASVYYQPDLDPAFDLGEAYLKFKAPPIGSTRLTARAGVFYPPVSLENDGVGWTTPDMLSASALNSWIGEEVKVAGAEATLKQRLGGHEFEATAAVFGWNDTAGTLLTFRGWALDEVRAGVRTDFDLPKLSPFGSRFQSPETYPYRELDHRAGYYGRLAWRPPAPVAFDLFYYDNAGNRTAVDAERQWAWETRFFNAGVRWEPSAQTRVLAQVMNGETIMGYAMRGGRWFDMGFQSAYGLVSRRIGEDTISVRIDGFRTRDRTFRALDDNQESGWATTASWRHRLASHADLILEAQHVSSKRASRRLTGEDPKQDQTVLQSAIRFSF